MKHHDNYNNDPFLPILLPLHAVIPYFIWIYNKINKMYNSRQSIGTKARDSNFFKTSLGNNETRYNSEVGIQRRKYLISSTYMPSHSEKTVKMFRIGWLGRSLTTFAIIIRIGRCIPTLPRLSSMLNRLMSMPGCRDPVILKDSLIGLSRTGLETNGSWRTQPFSLNGLKTKKTCVRKRWNVFRRWQCTNPQPRHVLVQGKTRSCV